MSRGHRVSIVVADSAVDTFTKHLYPLEDDSGLLNVSVSGLVDSIVTLQRGFNGKDFEDVEQYQGGANDINGSVQRVVESGREADECYRLGIKAADYGTDTVKLRLSH